MRERARIRILRLIAVVGVFSLISTPTLGQASTPARSGHMYDLVAVEEMEKSVGSSAAIELLARNGFVVTNQQFRQIFSAYTNAGLPVFITTDSAWHTYHVLLEEGVKQLEEVQAARLRAFSKKLYEAASDYAKTDESGFDQLADYASIALAFQDAPHLKSLPMQQSRIVQALLEDESPVNAFIGFPIDPERFRAKSFYGQSSALTDYFRARQWYAIVTFRLSSARETALAARLALIIKGNSQLSTLWQQLSEPYDTLLAKSEDGDLVSYATVIEQILGNQYSPGAIDKNAAMLQRILQVQLKNPQVNDQLLRPAQYEDFATETKGFRLFPPRRLPSAVCFQNTVDPKIKGRMFPSGLDFLVACKPLYSPAAKQAMQKQSGPTITQMVRKVDCGTLPDSLYGKALSLLATLQKPLPEQAPPALRGKAWSDKQLWTQLGAWAEQRHTWALHTKLSILYLCSNWGPSGMVSPYPDFFKGLADLSRETIRVLDKAGVGHIIDISTTAGDLLDHINLLHRLEQTTETDRKLTEEQWEEIEQEVAKLDRLSPILEYYDEELDIGIRDASGRMSVLKEVEKIAQKCAVSGTASQAEEDILKLFAHSNGKVAALLNEFAQVCDKLTALARKQLACEEFNFGEEAFIEGYGETLAKLHFYGGNSWLHPRDDFPILTPIFISPTGNHDQILYAGLARPQALYVVIPTKGELHLFRGAVLSYCEFRQPKSDPLDDETWRAMVKRGSIPCPPEFTRSFIVGPQVDR